MGEVYRARDATLNRDVALKVLPELFALDPDRLARFRREAQVLASLNHPNIAAIYGFEESGHVRALVLELVEGPTLADRLASAPIPVEEVFPIARQIAEALEAAHEQGIIHRDLKPANIKLRLDGTVKVLDFGLAKALAPVGASATAGGDATAAPTITSPAMTEMGMILGTAAYMSPEQARGRPADKRSDVWAFGAVLYEMLSGQRAFKGDLIADTLAAVLRQDLDWTALPASTPASVRRLLARCLDRDARQRLRDIGEARIVLADPAAPARNDAVGGPALAPLQPLWRRATPVVLAAIVAAALAGAAAWYLKPSASVPPLGVARFLVTLPDGQFFPTRGNSRHLTVSSDGTQMVFVVGSSRLFRRSISELEVTEIPGTAGYGNVTELAFSPDNRSIVFYAAADQTLKKIAVTGGAAVTICSAENPYGVSWGPEGIVFGQGSKAIMKVSQEGGTPTVLVSVKDGEVANAPQVLPGGKAVLFSLATGIASDRWDHARIVVQSLTSREQKVLIEGGSEARYVPTGHLVYALGGTVFAVAFDVDRLEVIGGRVPMVQGVNRAVGLRAPADFSISNTGSLVYIPDPVSTLSGQLDLALIDRQGGVRPLNLPLGRYSAPRVSPDGRRIAFEGMNGKDAIIYTYDLSAASGMQRLTYEGNNRFPVWLDDKRIAFQSDREGDRAIFWQPAVGTGTAKRVTKPNQGESHMPESWSPQADTLLFSVAKGSDVSLWAYSLRDEKAAPFGSVHSSNPTNAVFSPDGRWVAYSSTERDRATTYVQPFPATGDKFELTAKGGDGPHEVVFSLDGKELSYNPRARGFEVVSVTTEPMFRFGNPVALPRPFQLGPPSERRAYDITKDGRFLGLVTAGRTEVTAPASQIQVVLNWFEELKAQVRPTK